VGQGAKYFVRLTGRTPALDGLLRGPGSAAVPCELVILLKADVDGDSWSDTEIAVPSDCRRVPRSIVYLRVWSQMG